MRRALPILIALCLLFAGCAAPTVDSVGGAADEPNRERHLDRIDEAGSFAYDATLTAPENTQQLRAVVAPNRSRTRVTAPGQSTARFINATGTYVKTQQGNETTYRFRNTSPDTTAFTTRVIPFNATYERAGPGTVDGVPVVRYEAVNASDALSLGGYAALGYRNFSATLSVTDDGLVKRTAWRIETPAGPYAYNATYTDLGTATVRKPDWVSRAAAAGAPGPQVNFEFTYGDGVLRIQHRGGDTVDADAVTVRVTTDDGTQTVGWDADDGDVAAGDDVAFVGVSEGATVSVVWRGETGSTVLDTYTVPSN